MQILSICGAADLGPWESRAIYAAIAEGPRPGDNRDAWEREVGREPPGEPLPDGPFRRAAAAILRYDIFPRSLVEPVLRRAPLGVGDVAGIRYHFLPGVDLFFAARVVERFDEERGGLWRAGFTYRTLEGHPELGEETFSAEKDSSSGRVIVALRSWSRPGTLLARAFAPIVRVLQVRAGRAALEHLRAIADGAVERRPGADARQATGAGRPADAPPPPHTRPIV